MSVSSRMCPQDSDIVTVKTTSGNTQITVGALRALINAAGYNTAILINNYGGSEYALIWFQTVAEDLYLADDQTFLGLSRNYPIFGIKPNGSYGVHVDTTYRLKNDLSGFESFQDVNWNIGRSKEVDGVYYNVINDDARSTESFPAMCVSTYGGNIYCNGEPYVPPVQTHTSNGGGATHIAKVTGQLKDLSSNLSDILIVSGGGGGGLLVDETEYAGADAGGISGSGDNSADQSTGYAFGQGESGTNASGGGSGLYGGYKGTSSKSGGAGSGYIGNSLVSNKKMVGYNVPTSSAESTKTESVNEASENPVSGKPKIGNGFARIKFLRDGVTKTLEEVMEHSISQYDTLPVTNIYNFPYSSVDGDNAFWGGSDKRVLQYNANDRYYYYGFRETNYDSADSAIAIAIQRQFIKNVTFKSGIFQATSHLSCAFGFSPADTVTETGDNRFWCNYNHDSIQTVNVPNVGTYYEFTVDVNGYADYLVFYGVSGEWRMKDFELVVIE